MYFILQSYKLLKLIFCAYIRRRILKVKSLRPATKTEPVYVKFVSNLSVASSLRSPSVHQVTTLCFRKTKSRELTLPQVLKVKRKYYSPHTLHVYSCGHSRYCLWRHRMKSVPVSIPYHHRRHHHDRIYSLLQVLMATAVLLRRCSFVVFSSWF
jgi:hypothetical protein